MHRLTTAVLFVFLLAAPMIGEEVESNQENTTQSETTAEEVVPFTLDLFSIEPPEAHLYTPNGRAGDLVAAPTDRFVA